MTMALPAEVAVSDSCFGEFATYAPSSLSPINQTTHIRVLATITLAGVRFRR